MGTAENVKAIRAAYEAFLEEDVGPMMALISDDVEWHNFESNDFAGFYKGKSGVEDYLKVMDDVDFHGMDIETIVGDGNRVIGIVNPSYTVKRTGKKAGGLTVHVYDFDQDKIVRFREVAAHDGDAWD